MSKGNNRLTHDEAVAKGKKGGLASGKSRRRRKKIADAINSLLGEGVKDEKVIAKMHELGIDDKDMTNAYAIALTLIQSALEGDIKAIGAIQSFTGSAKMTELERAQIMIKEKELEIRHEEIEAKIKIAKDKDW